MLSSDIVLLVVLACFLAIPLSFYLMNGWLLNYEYHTSIPWYLYGLSGLGALSLTLLTISYQAIKAATQNPAESLRSE
jgi:ABC-type antimicrobial peptide transport system permease subunit